MLAAIHQTIPERHVRSFLEEGHYFTACSKFKDKEEFRYGYSLFHYGFTSAEELQECVARTHRIPQVNQWINSTGVSCWVGNIRDEARMWRDHGGEGPAIRVTMDKGDLVRLIEAQTVDFAHGDITYEGLTSSVRPQFTGTWQLGEASHAIHHMFFHKRLCYDWEGEFRAVLFTQQGQSVKSNPELIYSVKTSPLGTFNTTLRYDLREMFGDRFIESEAEQVAFDSRHSNEIDETITSNTLGPMFKELRRLEFHSNRIGRDWNDPKSTQPIEPVVEVTAKIHELKRAILAEQAAMKAAREQK